jgi:sugar lactone lactonase YvrE
MATATTFRRISLAILEILLAAALSPVGGAETTLFESRQLTPTGEYTFGIEGPAVDVTGTLYVVNLQKQGTIGRVVPGALKSELFAELPPESIGNAIRFDRDGRMYVADYKNHNVFVFERGQTEPRVYFHSDNFNQPNDLTVAADGTVYASDPSWKRRDGQIWRLTRGPDGHAQGEVMWSDRKMGTTNGIDLSPDGKTLYVGESETRELWAYRLEGAKLVAPRLVKRFNDFSLDGLRTDIDGRLFVARILKGTVTLLSPDGKVEREIPLRAKEPTNLAFGGPDGKTVFVTQRQGGFIEAFRVDRPGREYCLQKAETSDTSCQARALAVTK